VFNIQWVDVRPYLAAGQQPVFLLERPLLHGNSPRGGIFGIAEVAREGVFWVPNTDPVTTDGGWTQTLTGAHVRIPVLAYRTQERAIAGIWGLGLQLGFAAMLKLRQRTEDMPESLHIVLGHECTDLASEGVDAFRCYVGIAIRTK
jgi:hypothetical protein